MDNKQLVELLAINAYNAFLLCLIGDPPQFVREYHNRIRNPMPGDLVLEITSWRRRDVDIMDSVGRLEKVAHDESGNQIYTIQTLDDRQVTWSNATLIVIAEQMNR